MTIWKYRGLDLFRFSCRHNSKLLRGGLRPEFISLFPGKKSMKKLLYENDSRLTYKRLMPVMKEVYDNLDTPEAIQFPSYVTGNDLMICKQVLHAIEKNTNTINKNLLALEEELVEQAAELGDEDAITILAFKVIENPQSNRDDYKHANKLIKDLTERKHPLVFKIGGDFAFKKQFYEQAASYWQEFIDLEPNTHLASEVYCNLGKYYFQFVRPRPQLEKAKLAFENSIKFGDIDNTTIQAYFYLSQFYAVTDPLLSRYYLTVAGSKGLMESFSSLGFMEMNVFQNYSNAIEWFRLGVESNNDLKCLIGQFDCYFRLANFGKASFVLQNLDKLQKGLTTMSFNRKFSEEMKNLITNNVTTLKIFFDTRKREIDIIKNV